MVTLFFRTLMIYLIVFAVLRLTGKRQISNMQPFDLVVTLLIADVASEPISDAGIPMLYGVIPILAMFILHKCVAKLSLKSEAARKLVCGNPVILVSNGSVIENALRAAEFTMDDLLEQLRLKDVFTISEIDVCILETNGSISVYQSCPKEEAPAKIASLLVSDRKERPAALAAANIGLSDVNKVLNKEYGFSHNEALFVLLESDGTIHAQKKQGKRKNREAAIMIKDVKIK